jgi:YD repeat-containing protein
MTDRDRWDLRGPVHTCRLERTWEERGDTAVVEFRRDGSLARRTHINWDGSEWTSTREYDAEGRLLREQNTNASGAAGSRVYEYDSHGRLSRIINRGEDGQERVTEDYEYDAAGLKKKTHYVDAAAISAGSVAIAVGEADREQPAEKVLQDSNGRLLCRVEFTYDDAGRLVSEQLTSLADMPPAEHLAKMTPAAAAAARVLASTTRHHRYDDRGRRIETRTSMFGPLGLSWQTMAYNEHDDKIEEISEDDHRAGSIDDEGGFIESPAERSVHRSEARFRYEYDSHGNWIAKVVEGRNDADKEFTVSTRERRTLVYF